MLTRLTCSLPKAQSGLLRQFIASGAGRIERLDEPGLPIWRDLAGKPSESSVKKPD